MKCLHVDLLQRRLFHLNNKINISQNRKFPSWIILVLFFILYSLHHFNKITPAQQHFIYSIQPHALEARWLTSRWRAVSVVNDVHSMTLMKFFFPLSKVKIKKFTAIFVHLNIPFLKSFYPPFWIFPNKSNFHKILCILRFNGTSIRKWFGIEFSVRHTTL